MSLSRDGLLLDAIKEALALYQRSLVWATTAALSGLLIANRLQQNAADSVEILHGTVSAPLAWSIAQVLSVVFGALALSGIRRYYQALLLLNPSAEILGAIRLFPSLATQPGRFFRLGSVFLPVAATVASWTIELAREHRSGAELTVEWFMGLALVSVLVLFPYGGILYTLRALRLWSPGRS